MSLFTESVKSRIVVEELLAPIKEGSEFTFDYLMLLMVASVLAGVGLVTGTCSSSRAHCHLPLSSTYQHRVQSVSMFATTVACTV